MVSQLLECSWQVLLATAAVLARPRLPGKDPIERRDQTKRYALLRRVYREFDEMPGLLLTAAQAARLFELRPDIAARILDGLAEGRVLRQRSDGQIALRVPES
jgi:hypothetical protein